MAAEAAEASEGVKVCALRLRLLRFACAFCEAVLARLLGRHACVGAVPGASLFTVPRFFARGRERTTRAPRVGAAAGYAAVLEGGRRAPWASCPSRRTRPWAG